MDDYNEIQGTGEYYVYLIEATEIGHTKIGITGNIDRRLSTLQIGNSFKLTVRYLFFCDSLYQAQQLESALLSMFSGRRKNGEWVDATANEILSIWQQVCEVAVQDIPVSRVEGEIDNELSPKRYFLGGKTKKEIILEYVEENPGAAHMDQRKLAEILTKQFGTYFAQPTVSRALRNYTNGNGNHA